MTSEGENDNNGVDKDIPAYCDVEQPREPITHFIGSQVKLEPFSNVNSIQEARGNDVLCQSVKKIVKRDGTSTVSEEELPRETVLSDQTIKIDVSEFYENALVYYRH